MALKDLLQIQHREKIGLSEERVRAIIPHVRQYIALWREYPDLMVDFMVRGTRQEAASGEFKFYFYQRVFLRAAMRHQYIYAVFPRACNLAPIRRKISLWTNFFNCENPIVK